MEAIELLKALERYCDNQCKYHGGCDKCKFANEQICNCQMQFDINFMDAYFIEHIEQWAKENPVKTRQSEFLKMFPNATLQDEVLPFLPCYVDNFNSKECPKGACKECRRKYWLHEAE